MEPSGTRCWWPPVEARPTHASASTGSRLQRRDLGQCQVTDWFGLCRAILGQPVVQPGALIIARPTPLLMKAPPTMQLPRGFFVGTRRTGARFTSRPSPGTMRRNPVNRHAPAIDPQERAAPQVSGTRMITMSSPMASWSAGS